jgi:hypothetical protein
VTVTVEPVNDPPVARPDTVTTEEDTSIVIPVLDNDSPGPENENDQVLVIISATAEHGSVSLDSRVTLTYIPAPDFNGADTIVYEISEAVEICNDMDDDRDGAIDDGDAFVFGAPFWFQDADQDDFGNPNVFVQQCRAPLGFVDNNFDADDNDPNVTFIGELPPPLPPPPSPELLTATSTVFVTVTAVNERPVANQDVFEVPQGGQAHSMDVLSNDRLGPDGGESLTIVAVTQGEEGGIVDISTGGKALSYTAGAEFFGIETFTYTIRDGVGI